MSYGAYAGGSAFEASSLGLTGGGGAGGGLAGGMLPLVGGAIKAFGSIYAARQEAKSLKAQARAKQLEAEEVRARGQWDQMRMAEETRRLLSTQRQLFGQAGVTLEGAPIDVMARSKQEAVLDRMMHARNTGAEVAALREQAHQLKKAAKSAKRKGMIGAFSSFF